MLQYGVPTKLFSDLNFHIWQSAPHVCVYSTDWYMGAERSRPQMWSTQLFSHMWHRTYLTSLLIDTWQMGRGHRCENSCIALHTEPWQKSASALIDLLISQISILMQIWIPLGTRALDGEQICDQVYLSIIISSIIRQSILSIANMFKWLNSSCKSI